MKNSTKNKKNLWILSLALLSMLLLLPACGGGKIDNLGDNKVWLEDGKFEHIPSIDAPNIPILKEVIIMDHPGDPNAPVLFSITLTFPEDVAIAVRNETLDLSQLQMDWYIGSYLFDGNASSDYYIASFEIDEAKFLETLTLQTSIYIPADYVDQAAWLAAAVVVTYQGNVGILSQSVLTKDGKTIPIENEETEEKTPSTTDTTDTDEVPDPVLDMV
jgi:hypothetical protein